MWEMKYLIVVDKLLRMALWNLFWVFEKHNEHFQILHYSKWMCTWIWWQDKRLYEWNILINEPTLPTSTKKIKVAINWNSSVDS